MLGKQSCKQSLAGHELIRGPMANFKSTTELSLRQKKKQSPNFLRQCRFLRFGARGEAAARPFLADCKNLFKFSEISIDLSTLSV